MSKLSAIKNLKNNYSINVNCMISCVHLYLSVKFNTTTASQGENTILYILL